MVKKKVKEEPSKPGAVCPHCTKRIRRAEPPWSGDNDEPHTDLAECIVYLREMITDMKEDLRYAMSAKEEY